MCCREAPSFGSLSGPGVPSRPEARARSPISVHTDGQGRHFRTNMPALLPRSFEVTHELPVCASEPPSSRQRHLSPGLQPRRWKSNSATFLARATAGILRPAGFAREVAEKTGGRVKINVYPSGQLGSEKDMIEGLQIGSQQAGLIGSGSFQPIEPKLGIVELPYAWPTREHAYRAFDGELGGRSRSCSKPRTSSRSPGGRTASVTSPQRGSGQDARRSERTQDPCHARQDAARHLPARLAPSRRRLPSASSTRLCSRASSKPRRTRSRSSISSSFFEVQKSAALTGHVWGAACLVSRRLPGAAFRPPTSRRSGRARSSGGRSSAR